MNRLTIKKIAFAIMLLSFSNSYAITEEGEQIVLTANEEKEDTKVESALTAYLKAGDNSDVKKLELIMHQNYRVIFSDPVKNEVSEINREMYLDFVQKKIFGGKPRTVEIVELNVDNTIASLKVKTSSEGGSFTSFFSMIKFNGEWLVLQDLIFMN